MPNATLIVEPVFLALVTTEPHGEGKLVRFVAQRGPGERIERLISAPRLTLSQTRFTGLTNAQLDSAPDLDSALQDLLEFSEGAEAWICSNGALAQAVVVAAARDAGFPRALLGPEVIGLDDLAGVVLPTIGRRGILDILEYYRKKNAAAGEVAAPAPVQDEPAPIGDGLFVEPSVLAELWQCLEADLLKLPLPLLAEMNWLLAKSEHPLKSLLKKVEGEAVKNQFTETFHSGKVSLDKLFKDFSPIIKRLVPEEDEGAQASASPPSEPVSAEEIAKLLGPAGPLAANLRGYENRGEQIEMAQRVGEAMTSGKHLLAEAGTGIGKSMAYLVPSILFAMRANRPVMISTHTKNLQSQLFEKDLPLLRKHLGIEFNAALLKGRPNYLCLRKFMYTLQESANELDDDERAKMLPIMTWATQTQDGDVSEMTAFSREQNPELWDRLHTVGDDCLKRQCPFYNRCFVYKARGIARTADVVVLNHALVFSDLNLEGGALPPYNEIVFDEAHKLEDIATDHLACEITPKRTYKILNRLFRTSGGSAAGKGLLPALLAHVEQCRSEFTEDLQLSIREHIIAAMQAIAPAADGAESFYNVIREWTEEPPPAPDDDPAQPYVPAERGRNGGRMNAPSSFFQPSQKPAGKSFRGDDRKRFSSKTLQPKEVERFKEGKETTISTLGRVRQALDKLEDDFKEIKKRNVPRAKELTKEIAAQNLFLSELIHDIEFVVKGDEPNYVYWSERLGRHSARLVAAPLDIAALLHEQLYEKKRSIIFSSATLSVRDADADDASGFAPIRTANRQPEAAKAPDTFGEKPHPKSFEFLKKRLGLSLLAEDKLDEILLGSPFDYKSQCKLFLPTYLPEPGAREKDFTAAFTSMVGEVALASGGRTLVLYTSYAALEASAVTLRKMLNPEGIEVLAQGSDGSRESLLARLKAGGRTVLLGTASFWEGVDVRGDALSVLIIAKLPFAVFTDPIVQGRCELLEASGKDPFLHFSVPHAILKLRQGFGRLIRSRSDHGVVILADKRVLTRRYGAAFLRALPAQANTITSQDALVKSVKAFLQSVKR